MEQISQQEDQPSIDLNELLQQEHKEAHRSITEALEKLDEPQIRLVRRALKNSTYEMEHLSQINPEDAHQAVQIIERISKVYDDDDEITRLGQELASII